MIAKTAIHWPKESAMTPIPQPPLFIISLSTWWHSCYSATEDNGRNNWWGLRVDYILRHCRHHLNLPNHHSGKSQMSCHVDIQVADGEAHVKTTETLGWQPVQLVNYVSKGVTMSFLQLSQGTWWSQQPPQSLTESVSCWPSKANLFKNSRSKAFIFMINYCLGSVVSYEVNTGQPVLFDSDSILLM